jgi:hypothetical protein
MWYPSYGDGGLMSLQTLGAKYTIRGFEMEQRPQEALERAHKELQYELGKAIVAELWNRTGPTMVQLNHGEDRPIHQDDWGMKTLYLEALLHEVRSHRIETEYHIVADTVIHVPHFQYFPKDWVCVKCGCIVDGLHSPRMCDRCGGPRSTRKKAILAMGGTI